MLNEEGVPSPKAGRLRRRKGLLVPNSGLWTQNTVKYVAAHPLWMAVCEYGRRLSGRFKSAGDPPFEDLYGAHGIYLAILAGEDVEKNLDYFREQAEKADPETIGTYPAEVLVNLLLRLNRPAEALAVARKHLLGPHSHQLTCPSVAELCQKTNDYCTLAEVAREQGDAVHFMAGLLGAKK